MWGALLPAAGKGLSSLANLLMILFGVKAGVEFLGELGTGKPNAADITAQNQQKLLATLADVDRARSYAEPKLRPSDEMITSLFDQYTRGGQAFTTDYGSPGGAPDTLAMLTQALSDQAGEDIDVTRLMTALEPQRSADYRIAAFPVEEEF